jgi:hypothetical protein
VDAAATLLLGLPPGSCTRAGVESAHASIIRWNRRVLGACEVTAVLGDAVVRVSDARGQEFIVKQHGSRSRHDREVHAYRHWTTALAPSAPRLIAATARP